MIKKITLAAIAIAPFLVSAQKITVIPSVGYAWRTAKTADGLSAEEKEYAKGLKQGVTFDISAYYSIKDNWGLGLKYSNFSASNTGSVAIFNSPQEVLYDKVTTKDHISFFGPSFIYSNFNEDTKHKLYYDIALGVISYTSKNEYSKITGSNLGLDANFAYQYAITDNVFVGPKLGYTVGTLKKIKINDRTEDLGDNKEGLGRVNVSFAASFRF